MSKFPLRAVLSTRATHYLASMSNPPSSCQQTFMNSVVMQKLEVYTETAFANKTAKVSESSPQKEGCGDFFLSSCIGDSCGACERCQWQESLLRGRVSCSWSQALGCRTWWQYNVESKTNKVLLYCFNKDALTEHSWHRAEYLFILLLSQKKKPLEKCLEQSMNSD